MGPISSIGSGSASRPFPTRAPETGTLSGAKPANNAATMGGMGDALAQVTDLLSGLGGGGENNKMLEMLLVLVVLMAMLGEQASNSGQQGSDPSQLGPGMNGGVSNGMNGGGMYMQSSISMTSISIQQTSITSTTYLPESPTGGTGSAMDISA